MAHLEWKNLVGLVQWLRFDAVRTVEHHQNATVTKHPVQKGSDIADHVQVALPQVSMTGYISIAPLTVDAMVVRPKDIPIGSGSYQPVELPPPPVGARGGVALGAASAFQGGLIQAAVNALRSAASSNSVESLITENAGDRAATVATTLLRLQSERTLVRLVDELNVYEDMILTAVIGTRSAQIYGAAFQLEFERVKLVSAVELAGNPVPAEPRAQVVKTTASTPKDSGQPAVDAAKKSAAVRIAEAIFGGVGGAIRGGR